MTSKLVEKTQAQITDEWFTPVNLLILVRKFYPHGFHDPASCKEAQEYVRATTWCDRYTNALKQKWMGKIWLNPPYSQQLLKQFIKQLIESYEQCWVDEALCLVNNCTETLWFQELALKCDRLLLIKGRLRFWHPDKTSDSPRYGQVLFYLGKDANRFDETFGSLGLIFPKPR